MDLDTAPERAEMLPPQANGYAEAEPLRLSSTPTVVVAHGPQMPRRVKWLDLPEDYGAAGMKVRCWVNHPSRLAEDINSADEDRAYPALQQIVLEHNGWVDDDGAPFPAADTREFWRAISNELAATILRLLNLEGGRLPSSLKRPNAS